MVWMRPAGLSNFKKLWGHIQKDLKAGDYQIKITNSINFYVYKLLINFESHTNRLQCNIIWR